MSIDIKLKNLQQKFLSENDFLFPNEEMNVIIPFFPSGYEDYSNLGFVGGQVKIDDFLTYKRIYTGSDSFIVTWKGSTWIEPKLDKKGQIQIGWKLGEYILGWNESLSSDVTIEQDESFTDYKKHISTNTISFRIRADQYDLDENYKYLFYKIPEISNDILYRVVSLETQYIGRVKVCYVLTLQALQQDLESTGSAKSQNVMPNAPGQGYLNPKIVENVSDEDAKDEKKYQKIDDTRWLTFEGSNFINNPCKKVVVKQYGLSFHLNFTMVGRKISKNTAMTSYGIPRLIFPINFKQATTPTLYRTQQATTNYYFVWGLVPTIQFNKEMFQAIKDMVDVNKVWTQQGIITLPGKPDISDGIANTGLACQITNPKESDGSFKYSLYGFITTSKESPFPIHHPWQFAISEDLEGDNRGVFGSDTTYIVRKDQTRLLHDYLWDSYWLNKKVLVLPIDKKSTLTFGDTLGTGALTLINAKGVKDLILGGALFTIGILGTLLTNVPKKTLSNTVCGIFPASLLDFMTAEASVSLPNAITNTAWFKMSYLLNEESQSFLTFFNTETMNTSFEADLTDLFIKDGNTYETTLIGQTKNEDGTNIFDGEKQLLVNGSETLKAIEDKDVGFIIDSFNLQAMFSGDFTVEFLDVNNNIIWSGSYQSQGKWTNSIREINTWRNTSIYGRENIFLDKPKPWPEEIQLAPWESGIIGVQKDINFESSNSYNGDDRRNFVDLINNDYEVVDNNWPHSKPTETIELWNDNTIDRFPEFTIKKVVDLGQQTKDIMLVESALPIEQKEFWKYYKDITIGIEVDGKTYEHKIIDQNTNESTLTDELDDVKMFIGWADDNRDGNNLDGKDPNFNDSYVDYFYRTREPSPDGTGNTYIEHRAIKSQPVTMKREFTLKVNSELKFGDSGNAYIDINNIEILKKYKADMEENKDSYMIPTTIGTSVTKSKINLNIQNLCFGRRLTYLEKVVENYETIWNDWSKETINYSTLFKIKYVKLNIK